MLNTEDFFIQQDLLYIGQFNSDGIGCQPGYKNRVQQYPETRIPCRMSLQFVFPVESLWVFNTQTLLNTYICQYIFV